MNAKNTKNAAINISCGFTNRFFTIIRITINSIYRLPYFMRCLGHRHPPNLPAANNPQSQSPHNQFL